MEFIKQNFLALSILVGVLILSGTLVYVFGPGFGSQNETGLTATEEEFPTTTAPPIGDDPVLGQADAPVTMIEFGDYQCPFCGRFFSQTEGKLRENYINTGKVKLVYKDLIIIDSFVVGGHESKDAASAANCAGEQGKYWEYHDLIFTTEIADGAENNGNLSRSLFLNLANQVGLDAGAFTACYDSRKYDAEIDADTAEAQSVLPGASTPSTFINNRLVQGALPYEVFAQIIEEELNK
ncbi:MAG: DsbA family protein [Candidatus Colwellbacteria bacterium]|nr:DsbA family protein [Candidatus Colwellbacteria bacterium]